MESLSYGLNNPTALVEIRLIIFSSNGSSFFGGNGGPPPVKKSMNRLILHK